MNTDSVSERSVPGVARSLVTAHCFDAGFWIVVGAWMVAGLRDYAIRNQSVPLGAYERGHARTYAVWLFIALVFITIHLVMAVGIARGKRLALYPQVLFSVAQLPLIPFGSVFGSISGNALRPGGPLRAYLTGASTPVEQTKRSTPWLLMTFSLLSNLLLIAIVAPNLAEDFQRNRHLIVAVDIRLISDTVEKYSQPDPYLSASSIDDLARQLALRGHRILTKDPWRHPYRYASRGFGQTAEYEIASAGRNGVFEKGAFAYPAGRAKWAKGGSMWFALGSAEDDTVFRTDRDLGHPDFTHILESRCGQCD